mmetsp:Transcript_3710/g.8114  ORF Transcript_3710/g.8114 Transcript_3710/m.8114 type:complete len:206 (+) Transcript_3710:161-778(+)
MSNPYGKVEMEGLVSRSSSNPSLPVSPRSPISPRTPGSRRGSDDVIRIDVGPGYAQRGSNVNLSINARRSGSLTNLIKGEKGGLRIERQTTSSDLMIAVNRRLSLSSLPSILPIQRTITTPMLGAEDALERQGGKGVGAFCEHMYPLEVLSDHFQTHIDFSNALNSQGLSTAKANELLLEFGPNVLTPPPGCRCGCSSYCSSPTC